MNLLEPAHRRPVALITAASASEALGLCIIQIKNEFGHSMDFIRRAFRGAHLPGARLETFPLDAFFPPTSIHLNKQWTMGMKRYFSHIKAVISLTNPALISTQAPIYGKCQRCPLQPAGHAANDRIEPTNREHGRFGARRDGVRKNRNKPKTAVATLFNTMIKFLTNHFNHRKPQITLITLILPLFVMSLYSKHIVTGTTNYLDVKSQQQCNPGSYSSSKEKGTPMPPRVESLASTASPQLRVKFISIILIYNAHNITIAVVTGPKSQDKARRTSHHECIINTAGLPSPISRKSSQSNSEPEGRRRPDKHTPASPAIGFHKLGKKIKISFP